LACATLHGDLLVWDVKSGKVFAEVGVSPDGGADPNRWRTSDLKFVRGMSGLLVCRYTSESDVPEGVEEGKVGAERRAVWAVDLTNKTARPLGLGTTIHTHRMAVHPSGRWLALVGESYGEGEFRGKPASVGEVRIYDLPARKLALKRQCAEFRPMWVEFSSNGQRLACASPHGEAKAWDFMAPCK